ncbi:MAG: zinc ribbon domain-containing protein [Armatimonadetes bacterium]|nr:zinc ribbon domain-containing protein [Armatimonadota bacterium]
MINCPRCGKENEIESQFCSRCGLEIANYARESTIDASDLLPCYRHPGTKTQLRCGRCDRPICDRCTILGPAGQRCPDCAQSQTIYRPGAIGLSFKRMLADFWRNPFRIWILIILFSTVSGIVRSCNHSSRQPVYESRASEDLPER